MYALSLAASLLSSAGAGSLLEDENGPDTGTGAGAAAGRREVDTEWLGTDVSARALEVVLAAVCWVRSGCGGSADIFSV